MTEKIEDVIKDLKKLSKKGQAMDKDTETILLLRKLCATSVAIHETLVKMLNKKKEGKYKAMAAVVKNGEPPKKKAKITKAAAKKAAAKKEEDDEDEEEEEEEEPIALLSDSE